MQNLQPHPFDAAIALASQGSDDFLGHTSPAYWNMVGPFGGISAAIATNAVMQHPARLGEPVALTVNYVSALAAGPFTVTARAARTNRSTQHWIVEFHQADGTGAQQTVLTATALTAVRRDTWSANDIAMPAVPAPCDIPAVKEILPIEWINRYEFRFIAGKVPKHLDKAAQPDHAPTDSLTQIWVRDAQPRPCDFCSLAAFADVFFPRIFLRRGRYVPAGTVSMTVYFHANAADLHACAAGYLLAQARGQAYRNGFFDQSAQLWSEAGTLLVTSQQIVYYKE